MGEPSLSEYEWAVRVRRFDDGGLLPELRAAFVMAHGQLEGDRAANWVPSRDKWKPGPWLTEPDLIEWCSPLHGPYPLLMVRGNMGALCGYVGVPPDHPLYGGEEGDVRITETVTFGTPSGRGPVFITTTGEPSSCWWLGFDCGHRQFLPVLGAKGSSPVLEGNYFTIAMLRPRVESFARSLHALHTLA